MSYKTIIVHVDDSPGSEARVAVAAAIANEENAHLIGAATTGVSQVIYRSTVAEMGEGYIMAYIDTLRQRAEEGLQMFDALTRQLGVASVEQRFIDEETAEGFSLHARYCDLSILGQTDRDAPADVMGHNFPEVVAFHAGCPVLIVPYGGAFDGFPRNAVIAWDGGTQARRAVHDALPLLQRASVVDLAVFNAFERPDVHGPLPGVDIALYLGRHDVTVVIRDCTVEHDDIGPALLSLMAEADADLLVMGCYGHSRLREILLGGVTRKILSSMTVPVLMSH